MNMITKNKVNPQIGVNPKPLQGGQAKGIDFGQVNEAASDWIDEILEHVAPDGELQGAEYLMFNPHRNDGGLGSFKFNVDSCKWSDFACGDEEKGGDIVSLVAYLQQVPQSDAAKIVSGLVEAFEQATPTQAQPAPTRAAAKKAKAVPSVQVVPVPADAPSPHSHLPSLGDVKVRYTYTDEQGQTVCYICRFEPEGKGKDIRPQTYRKTESGAFAWEWKGMDGLRPLYNLHELVTKPDMPVLIVEGEKAAEAARTLFPDRVVVTTMGGAGASDKTDVKPLLGRSILIWPDHDEPGKAYAAKLVGLLKGQDPAAAAAVSVLKPFSNRPILDATGTPLLEPGFEPDPGWDAADALSMGWTAAHIQLLNIGSDLDMLEPEVEAEVKDSGHYTDDGTFWVAPDGVFKIKYKDGEEFKSKVCSRIDNLAQSLDDDGNWGFLLRVTDPDGVQKEWPMPRELLSSPGACRGELLRRGADVYPGGEGDLLCEYLLAVKPKDRVRCVSKPGWTFDTVGNKVFVLPNRVIGTSPDRVILQSKVAGAERTFGCASDLAGWQEHVAALSLGNSRLTTAVCAALTGPVLHLLNEENGGLHFVGPSSMGKTTAVELAASVWGRRNLFVKTWRNTSNALESVAARHNDTLLILDEIGQVDPGEAGEVAYMLGNGRGKGRSTATATLRAVLSWRLLFLSTGERSLAEHMETVGKRAMAGQEVRLINIAADAGAGLGLFQNIHGMETPQAFANRIKQATVEHYGFAGPAFVEALTSLETGPALLEQIGADIERFVGANVPADASGQVHRVGRRLGLVAAVGEAAIKAGILPWPEGEAFTGVRTCFQAWLEGRGGTGNQEADQAIAQVRRFLEQHGESRFTSWEDWNDANAASRTINRAGFRRITNDDRTEYYVLPEAFRNEVCDGLNSKEVTKALRAQDLLVLGADQKSLRQERLPGIGSKKVYRIKADILNDAD